VTSRKCKKRGIRHRKLAKKWYKEDEGMGKSLKNKMESHGTFFVKAEIVCMCVIKRNLQERGKLMF
jgi:hypothetical protein